MYDIFGYGSMIADRTRMGAYETALRRAITPGCIVADLGTGTGMMAMMAARMGAAKVYAIEPGDLIQVGRECARANGLADRIEFIQDISTKVSLTCQVDVIVSDMRGVLPLHHSHLASIADARRRFLKPVGVLIPQQDSMWMALVESPEVRTKWTSGWAEEREFDVTPALERATSVMWKANLARSALITEAQQWARLDYRAIDGTESEFAGEFTVAVQRDAKCDGIAVWFETSLLDEIGYSTEPGEKQMIYGQAVLPWRDAIALHAGDQVAVSVSANRVERDWFWRWQMKAARAGATLYDLHQSMLGSHEFTPERLRKMASNYRPSLSCEGEVEYMILGLMKDGLALKDIAERIRERFPQTFHDTQSALDRVADISCRYSR